MTNNFKLLISQQQFYCEIQYLHEKVKSGDLIIERKVRAYCHGRDRKN